jgi:hypothetical protein
MRTLRRLAGPLSLVILVAACAGSAAAPSAAPSAGTSGPPPTAAPPSTSPSPSAAVDAPVTDDPGLPVGTDVPPASDDPGQGQITIPKPGQLDPRPVSLDLLSANVDGRHVVVTASWTSGVEPCYVLDHIFVETGAKSFTITVFEGHGPGDNICIEIAKMKQARVDLGDLTPGTYTIADGQGRATPIEVTVS